MRSNCLFCDRPLKGRIDKKYCDESCRNSFNNRRNSIDQSIVRKINNILKQNRRILEELLGKLDYKKIKKDQLQKKGFDFTYLTHTYETKKNDLYHFVYEYGYLILEDDWILIVSRKKNEENSNID
ncbi:MAG: hypothetical protein Q4F57_04315 [Weeksellaceae bacterium]|nr:hypothetical protein [Weeksellaceae bacterium]